MLFATRPLRFRQSVAGLYASILVLGSYAGVHGLITANSRPSSFPAAPAVDPRLVVHSHAVSFSGSVDGVAITGTLSPSLPGSNTIHVSIVLPRYQPALGGAVSMELTMPGMAMPPVRTTLQARSDGYCGTISLPMFGTYRAQVDALLKHRRHRGTLNVTVPLIFGPFPTGDSSRTASETST